MVWSCHYFVLIPWMRAIVQIINIMERNK